MFDTANQNRLSTADRVDKAEYYKALLESERHGREQADKEIISLLHNVKDRYETRYSNYMAKKQNHKNKDRAEKPAKASSPEKQTKKSQEADNTDDVWGNSTEPAAGADDGWGTSTQPAEQANDNWDSWDQPTDKGDETNSNNQPAKKQNQKSKDKKGSEKDSSRKSSPEKQSKKSQEANKPDDDWGTSTEPAAGADDNWGTSTQPVEQANNNWDSWDQPADKGNESNSHNQSAKKQNQKNKDKNGSEKESSKRSSPEKQTKKAQVASKPDDDWGTSTQPAEQSNGKLPTNVWGASTQPTDKKSENQRSQKIQVTNSVSTSTDDHDKRDDWIQQINYLQTQLDVSRDETAKLKKRNLRLEKDLDHSKSLIRTLREGCSIVEDQARSFETRHDRIMSTKADLERELIAIKEESSRHITTINKLQKSNEQLSKAFIQSVQSHEACKKELDVLQQKYNRKLESYQIENLRLTEANGQLRKLVEYMQK